jgi:hypothetical protein
MRLRSVRAAVAVIFLASSSCAQLPPNQKLSGEDEREFTKELERLKTLLSTANDKGAIELQIANTYAAGGRFSEALRWLRKIVAENLGFDPSRDPDFAKLRRTAEFESIMDEVRRQTPPVHNSRLMATLGARDVRPESIAFDIRRKAFLLGNTARSELVECSLRGNCHSFVMPKGVEKDYVLGVKTDSARGEVWATDNTPSAASLRCYDLETGKLQRTASIEGKHVFNDLAISSTGTVYVTDTVEGSVYQLPSGTTTLQRMAPQHRFTAANGIAISENGTLLYVSAWGDGIDVIGLPSGAVMPMIHPQDVSLAFIDGLYAIQGRLIAIQNGPMLPRIVEFGLSKSQRQIIDMKILERRNPAFDGITTGVIVRNNLYYAANPQTDKGSEADLRPLQIFSVRIDR